MHGTLNIPLIQTVAGVLRDMLGEDYDEATFFDSLDGETDFMDIVGRLVRERVEADAFETAAKAAAETYTLRARRMAERRNAVNKALGALLDAINESKVTHPLATVSRTKARVSALITDEADVPTQLCKIVRAPDKTAILAALEAGEAVPGAELHTGERGVAVRVK